MNRAVRIRAYDPHPERIGQLEGAVEPAADEREAVAQAEVVVTAAPIVTDPDPAIGPDEFGDRWLVLPVDFDALVRRETIKAAELFVVDDVGQFEYYREQGHFRGWPAPVVSVGEALAHGGSPSRVACVNLGIGALDAAFAKRVFDAACERGVGAELPR